MPGDDFATIVQPHLGSMLRVAAALVGRADAEDAAQEAIVRAWQSLGELRDRAAMHTWLLRITVNVCHDWQRGRFGTRRRLDASLDEADTSASLALMGDDPGASDHAGALDLRQAIACLEEPLRLVIALRYYAGMDASEIGAALNVPPATIRTRLRRALTLLRQHLDVQSLSTVLPDHERSR